ncbi:unnamed protein product [Boreogadus saida]
MQSEIVYDVRLPFQHFDGKGTKTPRGYADGAVRVGMWGCVRPALDGGTLNGLRRGLRLTGVVKALTEAVRKSPVPHNKPLIPGCGGAYGGCEPAAALFTGLTPELSSPGGGGGRKAGRRRSTADVLQEFKSQEWRNENQSKSERESERERERE